MESRKKKRPAEITIKRGAAGGYITRHSFDNMGAGESYQPPKEYALADHKALTKHIDEHLGPDSGAYDGEPDVKSDDTDGASEKKRTGMGTPLRGKAPSASSYGAGVD